MKGEQLRPEGTLIAAGIALGAFLACLGDGYSAPGDVDRSFRFAGSIKNRVANLTIDRAGNILALNNVGELAVVDLDGQVTTSVQTGERSSVHAESSLVTLEDGRTLVSNPVLLLEPETLEDTGFRPKSGSRNSSPSYFSGDSDVIVLLDSKGNFSAYNPEGVAVDLPPAFDPTTGIPAFPQVRRWNRFVPLSDGNWLALGESHGWLDTQVLARLTADGSWDKAFSSQSVATGNYTLATEAQDGNIYVADSSRRSFRVVKFFGSGPRAGQLDDRFQTEAMAVPSRWEVTAMIADDTGLTVAVGSRIRSAPTDPFPVVMRFLHDGSPDHYFNAKLSGLRGRVDAFLRHRGSLYIAGEAFAFSGDDGKSETLPNVIRIHTDFTQATAPLILGASPDINQPRGYDAILSVDAAAVDGGPVSYQWHRDSQPIDGETGDTLFLSAAGYADEGSYTVSAMSTSGEEVLKSFEVKITGAVSEIDPDFAKGLPIRKEIATVSTLPDGSIAVQRRDQNGNIIPSFTIVDPSGRSIESESFGAFIGRFAGITPDGRVFGTTNGHEPRFAIEDRDGTAIVFAPVDGFEQFATSTVGFLRDGTLLLPLRESDDPEDTKIFRYLPDGTLHPTFSPIPISGSVSRFFEFDDGRILMTGRLKSIGGVKTSHESIAVITPEGQWDAEFDLSLFNPSADRWYQLSSALAPDGRMLLIQRRTQFWVSPDGSITPGRVGSGLLEENGLFVDAQGKPYVGRTRLLADGAIDAKGPLPDSEWTQWTGAVQGGTTIIAGDFTTLDGIAVPNIARLRPTSDVPIVFVDHNLENTIRDTLRIGRVKTITPRVLESLTSLDAKGSRITDLRGLENATALRALSIDNNFVADLTPVLGLNLEVLTATNNAIGEIGSTIDDLPLQLALSGNPLSVASRRLLADASAVKDVLVSPVLTIAPNTLEIRMTDINFNWIEQADGRLVTERTPGIELQWKQRHQRRVARNQ